MAIPTETLNRNLMNQPFTSTTQSALFTESLFHIKDALVTAGWTVTRSSNTSSVSDSDLWLTASDVIQNSGGSGSWIALSSPLGFTSSALHILLSSGSAISDSSPNLFVVQYSTGPYVGGSTTSFPTPSARFNVDPGTFTFFINSIPATGTHRFNSWSWDDGSVWFLIKNSLQDDFLSGFILSGTEGGEGDYQFCLCCAGNPMFATSWTGTTVKGMAPSGNRSSNLRAGGVVWLMSNTWTGGESTGSTNQFISPLAISSADNFDFRLLGRVKNLFATSFNTPFGTLDDSENGQTVRRVVTGNVTVFATAADLPFI